MTNLPSNLIDAFEKMDFSVQNVSYGEITSKGEMTQLGDMTSLPACDSSSILCNFPDLFVIHHSVSPDRGIFFVKYMNGDSKIPDSSLNILGKYFPKDLLFVRLDIKTNLVAKWINSSVNFLGLTEVVRARLEH